MSTFQISLAVAGLVLLALVLAYNMWQYRRNAPKKRSPQPPGTAPGARHDPVLNPAPIAPANAEDAHDPVLHASPGQEGAADPEASPAASGTGNERRPALSPLIDAIARVVLPQPLAGHVILQALPTTRRAGSKPFQVEGLNPHSQQWESVHADQRYGQLQAGVQLANRLGALNDIEFSEFVQKVQTLADSLGASVELPDMLTEVSRARELDLFADGQDAQLSFMLRPRRAAWSTGYIDQQATGQGFVAANLPGRMHLPAAQPGQAHLLTLSFDSQAAQAEDLDRTAVYELLISLDVPQVPREQAPFARMCQILHSLSQDMDAVLCDPLGNPVEPALLEQIGQDLEGYYEQLASRQLAAGSMLARRVFS